MATRLYFFFSFVSTILVDVMPKNMSMRYGINVQRTPDIERRRAEDNVAKLTESLFKFKNRAQAKR